MGRGIARSESGRRSDAAGKMADRRASEPQPGRGMMRPTRGKTGADVKAPRTLVFPGCAGRRFIPVFLFLVFPIVSMSCSTTSLQTRFGPVSPGHLFTGLYIDIRAPNSDGWHLTGSSSLGMEFARKGKTKNQTFGAQVLLFPWRGDRGPAGFMSQIREAFEADWRLDRYEKIEEKFFYSDKRKYPCVRINTLFKDKAALTIDKTRKTLLFQMGALYCLHPDPNLKGRAIAIIYSHRGSSLHPDFDEEAQDFFDGVQVPGKHL